MHLSLPLLEQKYFAGIDDASTSPQDAQPPVHRGTTQVVPLIDGEDYFRAVWSAIWSTRPGDAVYLVGWRFNPQLNPLTGELVPLTASESIGHLMAAKAAAGVDVRLVLNGTLALYWVPVPWAESLRNAELMRSLVPTGATSAPLVDRVLFDWSGANQSGSQHQKAVVVRRGNEMTAFVGGMDMNPNIWDRAPHDGRPRIWNGSAWMPNDIPAQEGGGRWGWHDVSVQLVGEAAKRVHHNFRSRWEEARLLPKRHYQWSASSPLQEFNPQPVAMTPDPAAPDPGAQQTHAQSVQVLRSRFKYKIPHRCGSGGKAWSGLPEEAQATSALLEVYATMKKAIGAATRYIYVEDQFLGDSLPGGQTYVRIDDIWGREFSLFPVLLKALADAPMQPPRLIFVGSGRKDPEDPGAALRNQTVTDSIQFILDGLPPALHGHVTVWRRDRKTVHSKVMIVDDEFMSIGSANFQSRSMAGVDNEISAAIVAEDDRVLQTRRTLWAEHFALEGLLGQPGVDEGLSALDIALGLWRPDWYPADPAYWESRTGYNDAQGYGGLSRVYP